MSILDEIGRQRTAEYGGAARKDIRALPEKVDENTPKFAIDFLDYYDNPERGQHPNSTGYYSYTSLAPMMNFFPFTQIETISPRPLLFIVGENAVCRTRSNARGFVRPTGISENHASETGHFLQTISKINRKAEWRTELVRIVPRHSVYRK